MDIKQFIFSDFSEAKSSASNASQPQLKANDFPDFQEDNQSQPDIMEETGNDTALDDEQNDREATSSFVTDTDHDTVQPPEEPLGASYFSQEEIELAKKLGFEEGHKTGYEEGYQKAINEMNEKDQLTQEAIHHAIEQLGHEFTSFTKTYWDQQKQLETNTVMLARDIALKLSANTSEEAILSKMSHLVETIVPTINGEPDITVSVHPDMKPVLTEHLETLMSSAPFWGDITIAAQADLELSDITISWENGSVVHSRVQIEQQIQQLLDQALEPDMECQTPQT